MKIGLSLGSFTLTLLQKVKPFEFVINLQIYIKWLKILRDNYYTYTSTFLTGIEKLYKRLSSKKNFYNENDRMGKIFLQMDVLEIKSNLYFSIVFNL